MVFHENMSFLWSIPCCCMAPSVKFYAANIVTCVSLSCYLFEYFLSWLSFFIMFTVVQPTQRSFLFSHWTAFPFTFCAATQLLSVQPSQYILCTAYPNTFCATCAITFFTANPISFCAAFSMALCSNAFPYALLCNLPFLFLCSLLSMALCGAFPYAFLRSLPSFFLCSLLNAFLQWCLPLRIFTQPTLLLFVQPTQWISVCLPLCNFTQPTLLLFVQPTQWLSVCLPLCIFTQPSLPFIFLCSLLSMTLCMPSLVNFRQPTLLFLCSLLNGSLCAFPYAFLRSLLLLFSVAYSQLLSEQTSLCFWM